MNHKSWLLGATAALACVPSFEERPWLVDELRILAVASEPAEVEPGAAVRWSALVVDPQGPVTTAAVYEQCLRPRTADERTAVAARCLQGDALEAATNPGVLLADACARFGPNTPPAQGEAPPQRPADPDPSGGYAVPIRVTVDGERAVAFGATRVRCDLTGATRAVFEAFESRYVANVAPGIASLELSEDSSAVGPGDVVSVEASLTATVTLAADARETFVVYLGEQGRLVDQAERLTVRWYVSDGVLDRGETVIVEDAQDRLAASVTWTAPTTGTTASVWAVVTDSRGGVAWVSQRVDVD